MTTKTKLTPQQALDSTKRVQYVDKEVVKTMPYGEGEIEFFKVGKCVNDDE